MQKQMALRIMICCLCMSLSACSDEQAEMLAKGEAIYTANCKVCHAQGINGAPIVGNSKMWNRRAEQGIPVLLEHASQGFGLMPAKGGNVELTEAELELAIRFMLSRLET